METLARTVVKLESSVGDLTDYSATLAEIPETMHMLLEKMQSIEGTLLTTSRRALVMDTKTRDELITSLTDIVAQKSLTHFQKIFVNETSTILTNLVGAHIERVVQSILASLVPPPPARAYPRFPWNDVGIVNPQCHASLTNIRRSGPSAARLQN